MLGGLRGVGVGLGRVGRGGEVLLGSGRRVVYDRNRKHFHET